MSNNTKRSQTGTPLTEDRGLQPAKNPPPMPQVKPTKPENKNLHNQQPIKPDNLTNKL